MTHSSDPLFEYDGDAIELHPPRYHQRGERVSDLVVSYNRESQMRRLCKKADRLGKGQVSDLLLAMTPLPAAKVRELLDECSFIVVYGVDGEGPGEVFEFIGGRRQT